jgi:lipopolysaccharide biosynthesis glycosyltransferase
VNRDEVRSAVRRGAEKISPLRRRLGNRAEDRESESRLVELYDQLRPKFTTLPARPEGEAPDADSIALVQRAVLDSVASNEYLRVMTIDGDFDKSLVSVVRKLIETNNVRRARSVAHVIRNRDGMQQVGDICFALVVLREPMDETAWELFSRNDVSAVLHLAPVEYFRVGLELDPDTALATLRRVFDGEFKVSLRAAQWLEIARGSFARGSEDLAADALRRAEKALRTVQDPARAKQLRADINALRSWFGRRDAARKPIDLPAGEIPFAVLDYQQAGRAKTAITEGEALNTLTLLGNLVRRRELRFSGDDDLVPLAETLHNRVAPSRVVDGAPATVHLSTVDRDASSYSPVPEGTWLIVSGVLMRRVSDLRHDLPFNPHIRPIFLGVEIAPPVLHGDGVIDYLKRYAPIGCRDWRTVFLLQAAGIPAFFSGWLTTTVDTVATEPVPDGSPSIAAGLPRSVIRELNRVIDYRTHRPRKTAELRTHLAARSVGVDVSLRPERPGDGALDGLAGLSDAEFDTLRMNTLELTETVLNAILDGRTEDEVYEVWQSRCAPSVEFAEKRRLDVPALPPPSFDVAAAVQATLDASVVVERSEPGPSGAEINVEFSLDGNYKHPLDVVLDSIVTRASRPIRAFVLCRDHNADDFVRMAKLFPTVSFVWLPTDHADYGKVTSMLKHITVATMDRLLLPDLLPDVDKIIHHDLDALCQADLAELFDLDIGDAPLAARDQRHPFSGSGYIALSGGAAKAATVDLSRELMQRLTTRHPFDFRNFNAGIMVLNLAQMRADYFTRNYLPLVERFGFNDQGVLNVYAGSQAYPMPRYWNAYPRYELVDDARILHWLGPPKPWHALYIHGQPLWRGAEASFAARAKAAGVQ